MSLSLICKVAQATNKTTLQNSWLSFFFFPSVLSNSIHTRYSLKKYIYPLFYQPFNFHHCMDITCSDPRWTWWQLQLVLICGGGGTFHCCCHMLVSADCWLKVYDCTYWQGRPWSGGEIMTFLTALGKRECCNGCMEAVVRQPSLSCSNNGANSSRVAHRSHFRKPLTLLWIKKCIDLYSCWGWRKG